MDIVQTQSARLGIRGTLEFWDKDGGLVKTIHMDTAVPLVTPDEVAAAQQLIQEQEAKGGSDDCK